MSMGDFTPGKTVRLRFNTHQATGTPITLAGTPAVSVYKGSTTESTAGVALTVDYDGRTGLHDVVIDTSADGTFYAAGNDFDVVITAGTVDSISVVGTVVGSFSLSNRAALRPTVADRTLDVSATGEAGLDWANIGGKTTTVDLTATSFNRVGGIGGAGISASSFDVNAITSAALDFSVDGRLADAVWDEQQSGHTTAGTFGKYLDAAVSAPGTLAAGAITEATITLPAEGAGTPTGALGLIQWIAGMFGWRKVVKDGTAITQYLADGTTPKTASTYTSLAGTDTINKAV